MAKPSHLPPTIVFWVKSPLHWTLLQGLAVQLRKDVGFNGRLVLATETKLLTAMQAATVAFDGIDDVIAIESTASPRSLRQCVMVLAMKWGLRLGASKSAGQYAQSWLRVFEQWDAFVRQHNVVGIMGCLEKSPLSAVLCALKQHHSLRLVTMQHGTFPRTHTHDLFEFDAFLLWDDATKHTVVADGFPGDRCYIVPNPLWETLQTYAQEHPVHRAGLPLGVLTQPINGFCSQAQRAAFFNRLCQFSATYQQPLLVRPHPSEDPGDYQQLLHELTPIHPTLTSLVQFSAQSLPLRDYFLQVSAAVSICSNALIDAHYANVPAAAVDWFGINAQLQSGIANYVPILTNPETLFADVYALCLRDNTRPAALLPPPNTRAVALFRDWFVS